MIRGQLTGIVVADLIADQRWNNSCKENVGRVHADVQA